MILCRAHISPHHNPKNVYIWTNYPELPTFYFDPLINPIASPSFVLKKAPLVSHENLLIGPNGADGDIELPEKIAPFLAEVGLENEHTADEIALWWAPTPYDRHSG